MAGQGFNRREALKVLAVGAAASQFAVFERWAYAHQEHRAQQKMSSEPYKPRFFTAAEYLTVLTLANLIIPADETAGAREAGTAEFTDFIVSHDVSIQPQFRQGLKWLEDHSQKKYRQSFVKLSPEQQTKILESLAYRKNFKLEEKEGQDFFQLIRQYTVMGYYTSKPGMEALGVPTLQAHFHSPECPHHDDPEHKKLKKKATV